MRKFIKRKDLYFSLQDEGQWIVYRNFPSQNPLQISNDLKAAYDVLTQQEQLRVSHHDPRALKKIAQSFKRWDLFESKTLQKKREDVYHELMQSKNPVIKLNPGYLDFSPVDLEAEVRKRAPSPIPWIHGLFLPHGHLRLTSPQISKALSYFDDQNWPDLFLILGTSHYQSGIMSTLASFSMGETVIDNDSRYLQSLGNRFPLLSFDSPWIMHEHSWAIFLPLLQQKANDLGKKMKVAPIMMNHLTHDQCKTLAQAILETTLEQFKRVCVVVSGDLSHVGRGYAHNPYAPFKTNIRRSALIKKILAYEKSVLKTFFDRNIHRFQKMVHKTSFCGKSAMEVLLHYAKDYPSKLLHHEVFLNFEPHDPKLTRKAVEKSDQLFSTATGIFAHRVNMRAPAPDVSRKPFFSPHVLGYTSEDRLTFINSADLSQCTLAGNLSPTLSLLSNFTPAKDVIVRDLRKTTGQTPSQDDVQTLLDRFSKLGFTHPIQHWNLNLRKQWTWTHFKKICERVPYYVPYKEVPSLEDLPILNSQIIRNSWPRFFTSDFDWRKNEKNRKKFYTRNTSASTGPALRTFFELPIYHAWENRSASISKAPSVFRKKLTFNRPSNIFRQDEYKTFKTWPRWKSSKSNLRLTPGLNVTKLSKKNLDQSIVKILKFKPDHLHGSPEFLAALGLRIIQTGIQFKTLQVVDVGHNYLWAPYRKLISEAFRCPISVRYHSSEFGPIAVTCEKGRLHLAEYRKYIELLDAEGRFIRPGQVGRVVISGYESEIRPIFRYDQGDTIKYVSESCSCGLPFRVVEFLGRTKDLIKVSGKLITYPDVDRILETIEAPFFFSIRIRKDHLKIDIASESENFPTEALIEPLERLYQRSVSISVSKFIPYASHGKLLGIQVDLA